MADTLESAFRYNPVSTYEPSRRRSVTPTSRTNARASRAAQVGRRTLTMGDLPDFDDFDQAVTTQQQQGQFSAPPELPWWKEALGKVSETPAAHAAFFALDLADIGRRGVESTLQEGMDWLGIDTEASDTGHEGFSTQDWLSQVRDSNFGFGTMAGDATGNRWVDRTIGLAGDIILDPFTYLTFATSSAVSGGGRASRMLLAARASEAGMAEEVIDRAGRLGIAGLDQAEREFLNTAVNAAGEALGETLPRSGYYFQVPGWRDFRIPGTESAARWSDLLKARTRQLWNESSIGSRFLTRAPEGLEGVYQRLVHGRGTMDATTAAEAYRGYQAGRAAAGTTQGLLSNMARVVGNPSVADNTRGIIDLERNSTGIFADFFRAAREDLDSNGFDVTNLPDNYFPHLYTDRGRKLLQGDEELRKVFDVVVNDADELAPMLQRRTMFKPRDKPYNVRGVDIKIDPGDTLIDVNAKLRAGLNIDYDVFETQFQTVATRYAKAISKSTGSMAMQDTWLKSKARKLRNWADDTASEEVIDKSAMDLLNNKKRKEMLNDIRDARKTSKHLRKQLNTDRKGLLGDVQKLVTGTIDDLTTLSDTERTRLLSMVDDINTIDADGTRLVDELQNHLVSIDERFDTIVDALQTKHAEISGVLSDWRASGARGQLPQRVRAQVEALDTLRQQAAELAVDREDIGLILRSAKGHQTASKQFTKWADEAARGHIVVQAGDDGARRVERAGRKLTTNAQGVTTIGESTLTEPMSRPWVDGLGRIRRGPVNSSAEVRPPLEAALGVAKSRRQAVTATMADTKAGALNDQIEIAASSYASALAQHRSEVSKAGRPLADAERELRYRERDTNSLRRRLLTYRGETLEAFGEKAQLGQDLIAAERELIAAQRRVDALSAPVREAEGSVDLARRTLDDLEQQQLARARREVGRQRSARTDPAIVEAQQAERRTAHETAKQDHLVVERRNHFWHSENPTVARDARRSTAARGEEQAIVTDLGQVVNGRSSKLAVDGDGRLQPLTADPKLSQAAAGRDAAMTEMNEALARFEARANDLDNGVISRFRENVDSTRSYTRSYRDAIAKEHGDLVAAIDRAQAAEKALARFDRKTSAVTVNANIKRGKLLTEQADLRVALAGRGQIGEHLTGALADADRTLEATRRALDPKLGGSLRPDRFDDGIAGQLESISRAQRRSIDELAGVRPRTAPTVEPELPSSIYTVEERETLDQMYRILRDPEPSSAGQGRQAYEKAREAQRRAEAELNRLQKVAPTTQPPPPVRRDLFGEAIPQQLDANGVPMFPEMGIEANEVASALRPDAMSAAERADAIRTARRASKEARDLQLVHQAAAKANTSPHAVARRAIAEIEARHAAAAAAGFLGDDVLGRADAEIAQLRDVLGQIESARKPLSKREAKALSGLLPNAAHGGDRSVAGRGRNAVRLSEQIVESHAERLTSSAAISPETLDVMRSMSDTVNRLLSGRGVGRDRFTQSLLRQSVEDLERHTDVLTSYAELLARGVAPTPQIGTMLLDRRLAHEVGLATEARDRALTRTAERESLYATARQQGLGNAMSKRDDFLDRLERVLETDNPNPDTVRRLRNRVSYWQTKVESISGMAEQFEDIGGLDDLIDSVVQTVDDVMGLYSDTYIKSKTLRNAALAGNFGFMTKATNVRTSVEYLSAEVRMYQSSMDNLSRAINDSAAKGRPLVTWYDGSSVAYSGNTKEVASALLGGETELIIPEYRRADLERRVKDNTLNRRSKLAYTNYTPDPQTRQLPLSEAKALYESRRTQEAGPTSLVGKLRMAQRKLDFYDGSLARQIEEADILIRDLTDPPDLGVLTEALSDLQVRADVEDLTPAEEQYMDLLEARIEQLKQFSADQLPPNFDQVLLIERTTLVDRMNKFLSETHQDGDTYVDAMYSFSDPDMFIKDLIDHRLEWNEQNQHRLKEILRSSEGGELYSQMLRTLDEMDPNLPYDEAKSMFAALYGEGYRIDVEDTGDVGEITEGIGAQLDETGQVLQNYRSKRNFSDEMKNKLWQEMSVRAREVAEEVSASTEMTLNLLGLTATVDDGASGGKRAIRRMENISKLIGYQSNGLPAPNRDALRKRVTEMLISIGYDPTNATGAAVREANSKIQRLEALRVSLGAVLASQTPDAAPLDRLLRIESKLGTANDPGSISKLIEEWQPYDIGFNANALLANDRVAKEAALTEALPPAPEPSAAEIVPEMAPVAEPLAPAPSVPKGPSPEEWQAQTAALNEEIEQLTTSREQINAALEQADQINAADADLALPPSTPNGEVAYLRDARMLALQVGDRERASRLAEMLGQASINAEESMTGKMVFSPEELLAVARPPAGMANHDKGALMGELDRITEREAEISTRLEELGLNPPESENPFGGAGADAASSTEALGPTPQKIVPSPQRKPGIPPAIPSMPDAKLDRNQLLARARSLKEQLDELVRLHGDDVSALPPKVQRQAMNLARDLNKTSDAINRMNAVRIGEAREAGLRQQMGTLRSTAQTEAAYGSNVGQISGDWESILATGVPNMSALSKMLRDFQGDPARFGVTPRTGVKRTELTASLESMFGGNEDKAWRGASVKRSAAARTARDALTTAASARDGLVARRLLAEESARHLSERAAEHAAVSAGLGDVAAEMTRGVDARAGQLAADEAAHVAGHEAEQDAEDAMQSMAAAAAEAYERQLDAITQQYTTDLLDHHMTIGHARQALDNELTALNATDPQSAIAAIKTRVDAQITQLKDLKLTQQRLFDPKAIDSSIDEMKMAANLLTSMSPNDPALAQSVAQTVALLDSAQKLQDRVAKIDLDGATLQTRIDQFDKATRAKKSSRYGADSLVAPVITRIARDGWEPLISKVRGGEKLWIAKELAESMRHLETSLNRGELWNLLSKYTAFFKAYATARPGFHVRNSMSGLFMNAVAGVGISPQIEALRVWKLLQTDPKKFWAAATDRERKALMATWGSGAVQFAESTDLLGRAGDPLGGRVYKWFLNNRLMQMNRRWGERIEGVMRLGMALDSIDRGGSLNEAIGRITKYHFDYSEVSKLDRKMKMLIPFWTFMSRNVPLQITQMWENPRMYLWYQSFVRNFGEQMDPYTPDYWISQGAFTTDENASESDKPWYLAPDLPHLRVAEPMNAAMQGDWSKVLFSDLNPMGLAPLEALIMKRKAYTGEPIEGMETMSPAMYPFLPALMALDAVLPADLISKGGTSGDTLIDERASHLIRTLLPPVNTAERIIPGGDPDSPRSGRAMETLMRNFLGLPVYQLTDQLRNQTQRGRVYDQRDATEQLLELARS